MTPPEFFGQDICGACEGDGRARGDEACRFCGGTGRAVMTSSNTGRGTGLSGPQFDALRVLAAHDGEQVRASKRKTRSEAPACVNIRAVRSLVDRKLARIHFKDSAFWSPYTHDEQYSITGAGYGLLAAHGELPDRPEAGR